MIPQEIVNNIRTFFSKEEEINIDVYIKKPIGGGCINSAFEIKVDNKVYFLKYNNKMAFPLMFEQERKGLELLSSTNTFRIPEVIHCDNTKNYSYLLLEMIEAGKPLNDFFTEFGKQLARLHSNTSTTFGLDHDNYIGSLNQYNKQHDNWSDFFVTERLEPLVENAVSSGNIPSSIINRFTSLFYKLDNIFPTEKPSLLHGDLWNGNYIVDKKGNPVLIDPAVYYGHREMDISMSLLFGGFSPEFYNSYNDILPMEKGWQDRVEVCNIYPLLVHIILFGSSYLEPIKRTLTRFT
ncbi:MAG: fructosamine kinase family protein [Hyphomicrobiales bacterium]